PVLVDGAGWAVDLVHGAAAGAARPMPAPEGFEGELRHYQAEARGWLAFLDRAGLGGCLAMDMGLGKTPTVLAHLLEHNDEGPALVIAPPASAHAQLVLADPPIDRTHHLDSAPSRITLTFSEHLDVSTSSISVVNSTSRQQVDLGSPIVSRDPPTMMVGLPADLPPGTYVLQYNAVSSDDGHPNRGTIGFAIGNFAAPPSSTDDHIDYVSAASRAALYAGFCIAFAAAVLLAWLPGYPAASARRALVVGTTLHVIGVMFLFRQAYEASGATVFTVYTGSDAGTIYLVRSILGAGAWVLAMLEALRPTRTGPFAATLLLLGAALGSARLGHGSVQGPTIIAIDFAHLLSASVWVGGLILFAAFLYGKRRETPLDQVRAAGIRFGTIALTSVALLALSGLVLAIYILGAGPILDVRQLFANPYRSFLAGKVAIAALMVLLAGINRYVLLEQPRSGGFAGLVQGSVRAVTGGKVRPGLADGAHLGRMVAIEATLGAVVLVLAGFLTSVSPPAVAASGPAPMAETVTTDHYVVHLKADPPPKQGVTSEVFLQIERLDPTTGATQPMLNNTCGRTTCVTLTVQYDGAAGPEQPRDALLHQDGWYVHSLLWSSPGRANVTIAMSDPPIFEEDAVFSLNVSSA
ncbi:MAG: copper resistance protein CopC, partial [Thermoplasmatota archaeon]